MSKGKFVPDIGFGAVYKNDGKGPSFKGYVRTESGIVGLALWKKETRDGDVYYSVSEDKREGKYHAEKFGLDQAGSSSDDRGVRSRDQDDNGRQSRDERRPTRGSSRDDEHDRAWRGDRDDRSRRGSEDDFDDEIPFGNNRR
jgi:hypothetical protein